jgi:hypothetical protein
MSAQEEQAGFIEYLVIVMFLLLVYVLYIIRLYGNPKNFPWHSVLQKYYSNYWFDIGLTVHHNILGILLCIVLVADCPA